MNARGNYSIRFDVLSTERRVLRNKISLYVCLFVRHRVKKTFSAGRLTVRSLEALGGNSTWEIRIRGPNTSKPH